MLIWAEPFEQYGGNFALLGNSGYNIIYGAPVGPGRTGTRAIQFNQLIVGQDGRLTRPFDVLKTDVGMGMAFNPQGGGMLANNFNSGGFRLYDAGMNYAFNVGVMSDGSIGVWDAAQSFQGKTPANLVYPDTWTWVEVKILGNTAGLGTGHVEVRVQGVTQLIINNINIFNPFGYYAIGGAGAGNQSIWFDDWIVWDTTGVSNNTFMGDRRLWWSMPNANGLPQQFIPSAGAAFNCVNQVSPVDTTFIQSTAPGDVSEFAKQGIGINSTDIAAVVVVGRLLKTDAGMASARVGINSNGNVANSTELFPPITVGQYFYYPVERDPNGNLPWTKAAADAANIRVTRVQ